MAAVQVYLPGPDFMIREIKYRAVDLRGSRCRQIKPPARAAAGICGPGAARGKKHGDKPGLKASLSRPATGARERGRSGASRSGYQRGVRERGRKSDGWEQPRAGTTLFRRSSGTADPDPRDPATGREPRMRTASSPPRQAGTRSNIPFTGRHWGRCRDAARRTVTADTSRVPGNRCLRSG